MYSNCKKIQSRVCNTMTTGMKKVVESGEAEGIRSAVKEMIKGREIKFPRQIIFKGKAEVIICLDGLLTAYGAAAYVIGPGGANILTSVGKVIGKGKYTAPKSEMSGAVLATRLFRKIQEELTNVKVSRFRFVGDSTIVLQMIAKTSRQP